MGEKQIKSDTNRMTKTIGKTTYIVNMHFKDKGENFSQKLKRVLRADAVKSIS